ncbi:MULTISPECIES: TetR/AcrR family transcriptional regulator [unclassified Nocardioides]|uniref:TetR/AcrR family transcriptional regulator n=1 Tax=unclassified Nocardioides TaxID=2615069 RepID=UPI0011529ADB|nr:MULTISPECIES: TetR/AcrR family transcriptional regulator [unclassified Nocardioides]TQK73276.1 TetR family transcriptional regulator [Nocardioides sp. SLBN-35]WGY02487.1 TetR/AcrR family transcriptional regulator [Nocardioides sp. QY071]
MGTPKREQTDGRKRRWQQHNADRRQAVIEAALTVLARDLEPGAELSVQQIADEASVHRTVLYRYFEDRTDLDVAIQQEICSRAGELLLAAVTLEGTPRQIVERIIAAYVGWGADNVALMRFAERDIAGAASKPLDDAIGQIAEQIELVIGGFLAILDAEVDDDDRNALTPYVFLLVGGVIAAVRSWSSRDELVPPAPAFTRLLADVTWLQIEGLAASRRIEVPDLPVEQLLNFKEA